MNTYDNQDELATDKVTLDNVMNQASMPLQEWASNNEHFNSLYQLAVPVTQNVLGISWNPNTDNMNVVVGEKLVQEDSWRYTKRKVLSLVYSIYDPLGWVSPLTVGYTGKCSYKPCGKKRWVGIKSLTLIKSKSFMTS